jgi:hypothetical protein
MSSTMHNKKLQFLFETVFHALMKGADEISVCCLLLAILHWDSSFNIERIYCCKVAITADN